MTKSNNVVQESDNEKRELTMSELDATSGGGDLFSMAAGILIQYESEYGFVHNAVEKSGLKH